MLYKKWISLALCAALFAGITGCAEKAATVPENAVEETAVEAQEEEA